MNETTKLLAYWAPRILCIQGREVDVQQWSRVATIARQNLNRHYCDLKMDCSGLQMGV